jgi:aerobic carbon-monoxide dehydrogenase medium subunit
VKPAPFRLHRPTTVSEATAVFAEYGDEAKVLAGGQSLVPLLALRLTRFEHLVDLNGVTALRGIERQDGALRVGAMVRQAEAEHNDDVAASLPLLHRALPHIGHFQIRNRGTVGGSTAHADPASELPAVASALDAEMEVTGPTGVRTIAARDFFQSMWATALEPDEILTAVRYPVWESRCGFAVEEFARRSGDFAIAGVACGVALTPHGTIARAAIALFGMGTTPLRADAAESALLGSPVESADLRAAAAAAASATDPSDDIHGTAAFRRRVAAHLTERALARALEEATGV